MHSEPPTVVRPAPLAAAEPSGVEEPTAAIAPIAAADDEAGTTLARPRPPLTAYAGYFEALREQQAPKAALSGLIAWLVTVAPAGFGREAPIVAALTALAALFAGVGGAALIPWRRPLARHVGISAFVALAVLTWLLGSAAIHPSRLDPVRGITGAVAWGVYGLAWSERWALANPPVHDPEAPLLQARATLPPSTRLVLGFGVAAAFALIFMAWRARDPDRALLAHAVALVCAVAVVSAAATISTSRGKAHIRPSRRLPTRATRALLLLIGFAIAGAAAMLALR